ncbi:hypothetical protein O3M35_007249 [Rhynocoris fuscipes]|uniref:Reverse transcriptase zinc-binding domain-containing protein n=1 Tax=Rhynocoris fuscipes TaxID=488301 RepID=A0AAW1D9C7_9HEMI
MESTRYPKICLKRLKEAACNNNNNIKYNWYLQLVQLLKPIEQHHLLDTEDSTALKKVIPSILDKYNNYLRNKDLEKLHQSNFSYYYKLIFNSAELEQNYLLSDLQICYVRLLAQLRTSSKYHIKLTYNSILYTIDPLSNCIICNSNCPEDLYHIMFICPPYTPFRTQYLQNINQSDWPKSVLSPGSTSEIKNLFYYVTSVLKLRAFILSQ